MAEILKTIVGLLNPLAKIKQYVIDPLKVHFSYLCCSDSILESLKTEVQRLDETRESLQLEVDAARRNLEIIGPDVKHWLESADKIKEKTNKIFETIPEVEQGCANVSCPNLKLRYCVSREAEELTKAVFEVRAACRFDRVGHSAPPPVVEIIPVASVTEFESRKTKEEEIMAALRDDNVCMIGICGMGGVGKTTMVKEVRKRARAEILFDAVAMAVVSQQPDRSGIQEQIAEALGLQLGEKAISIRASKIHNRLMDLKKILIIIDDIWEWLNLEELGIPSQSNHKGCKIILTSRDRHVCSVMKATKVFPLESLLEKEAWTLFKDKAGTCVDDLDLHQIAVDVAKECKGLPLALVTVGRALADQKANHVWEDALVQLQRSAPSNIPGVLEGVYRPLELSYNYLESDEARYLFLLCCLFPEDSEISLQDLVDYGVGLRIFSNVETLKETRNRVYTLVGRLESRHMLMDGGTCEGIKCVRMHDVIRDMAIHIASAGKHVFISSHDTGLNDWPRKDSYENYTCISLTREPDVMLPECINCPKLKLLSIQRVNFGVSLVPGTIFERMRELNVLDIGGMISPPSYLELLTNLRTLRLHNSQMRNASIIGQLVKLEILDLSDSEIEVLPKEIGGLENLKSLDLRRCYVREVAPGVISRLVRLEELFVLESFKNWEAEVKGKERGNASLVEVASLKDLTALELEIPDPKVLPQDTLHWPKLERFVIWIGMDSYSDKMDSYSDIQYDYGDNYLFVNLSETTPLVHALIRKANHLQLELGGMVVSDEVIMSIQERNQDLKSLRLDGCNNMKYLANILSKENTVFSKLKSLSFSKCRDLERICSNGLLLAGSFDALKHLKLNDLCKLTHLWDQNVCLPNLKELFIQNCSSLQYVFLQCTAESLSRLEVLEIEKCPALKEVFKAERRESANVVSSIEFTKLTKLSLLELPNLSSFCKAVNELESSCNSDSQFLFHQKVTFASLVELKLRNVSTATKVFSSQIRNGSFSQLKLLEFESCPNLKVIFSPLILRNFRRLGKLAIKDCFKLEEMIRKEDEESHVVVMEPLFPELKELILSELPNFKKMCQITNDIELPQLESMTLVDCHQMETFSLGSLSLPRLTRVSGSLDPDLATQIFFKKEETFSMGSLSLPRFTLVSGSSDLDLATRIFFKKEVTVANLVELKLYNISISTDIFSSQIPIGSFSPLEVLEVESCPNLKIIFCPSALRNFRKLRELTVKNCSKLNEVIGDEDDESQAAIRELLFPELKILTLSELSNLKTFCHMKNDTELPQLENITIVDCHQLETFSLGSLFLPRLTYVYGLLEPDLATQIFFKKEIFRNETHLKNDSFTLWSPRRGRPESGYGLAKDSSDNFVVFERLDSGGREVPRSFAIAEFSPGTLYGVVFKIKLEESALACRGRLKLVLTQSEGITQVFTEYLEHKPRGKWIDILVGEFTTGPDPTGDLEFIVGLYDIRGLLLNGVVILPKA